MLIPRLSSFPDRMGLPTARWRSWRKSVAIAVMAVALSLAGFPEERRCLGGTSTIEQDQIKAAYLYNFLHVVSWPGSINLPAPPPEQVIGVIGSSPLHAVLDELAEIARKGKKAAVNVVHFSSYREGMDLMGCNILFVSDSERENFQKITATLNHAPILTVAESEDFLAAGGMIALVKQQNRVRYRINRHAASEAGLRLSSQLLQAAIGVEGD